MNACSKGHLDVVKTLIEAGANVKHTNKVGKYLHCCTSTCACTYTHIPLVFGLVYTRLHVCLNDAMDTNAGFKISTCTCKPWLHGINLTCKGDHAVGNMLCATQINTYVSCCST